MFKELKEIMFKELKDVMTTMNQQIEILHKEMEIVRKEPKDVLELKNAVTIQSNLYTQCNPYPNPKNILFCRNRKIHPKIHMESQGTS